MTPIFIEMMRLLPNRQRSNRSPLIQGGFSCFSDTPHREGTGGGVLVMVGVWLPSPLVSPTLEVTDNLPRLGEDNALPRM
jgi:hypothetical protein